MGIESEQPPPIRTDLEITPQHFRGQLSYVVKDPVSLSYYRLGEVEYIVLKCFQEGHDIEHTQHEVKKLTGSEVEAFEVYKYANQLRQSNLLKSKGMGDARRIADQRQEKKKSRFKRFISNYLFMTIPLWDPDETIGKLLPIFRFFFRPFFGLVWLALAAIAVWIMATNFSTLVAEAFSLLSPVNLLILSGVIFFIKFFHELGHAFTCKHFGGEVHAIGPAFLVFQPAMFTETNDAWSLTNKWHRVIVTFSGLGTEIMLAAIAAIIWITSEPGFVKQVAYSTMVAASVHSVLFNANPLLRFDGYYMLMDLVEIPNLRMKASQYLEYLFDRYVLGLHRDPPALDSAPHTYVIYGVLRILYRIIIIVSISFFLYSIFEPLGVFSLISSTYGMIVMPIIKHGKELKQHYQRGKISIKYGLAVLVFFILLGAALFVPITYSVSAPVVFMPETTSTVRAPVTARVDEILVKNGERVEKGQEIARLTNTTLVNRYEQLTHRIDQVDARMRGALERDQAAYQMLVREKNSLENEKNEIASKIDRLTLRAPFDGVIMDVHQTEARLGADRHGFVGLNETENAIELRRFEGSVVRAGTGLMAVGNTGNGSFATYVREYDLSYIGLGDQIDCLFRFNPETRYSAVVGDISAVDVQTIENVGITLADVGFVPVEPTPDGRKRPLVTLYQVNGIPNDSANSIPVGMTGKARINYGEGPWIQFVIQRVVKGLRLRLRAI